MQTDEIIQKLNQIEKKIDNVNLKAERSHYKTDEACIFMSCSTNSLTKMCIENNIFPVKLGGVNYYCISDFKNLFSVVR